MYQIKQVPEDFIVEEIPDIKLSQAGDYLYFTLEKKNWTTLDAVAELARRLNVKENRFNIAGIKDKNAITKQVVSAYRIPQQSIARIKIKDIKFNFIGRGDERIKLGQIKKNKFSIVVRNLDNKKYRQISFIENYFDEQRFSHSNVAIGHALVKKDFPEACALLGLDVQKNDYIGFLRNSIKRKILLFYVNAYQSYLFNKAVIEYVKNNSSDYFNVKHEDMEFIFSNAELKDKKLPLIGFLSVIRDKEIKKIFDYVMAKEGVGKDDFLFPMMPELSSEGNERNLCVDFDVAIKFEDDELNIGKYKAVLDFALDKGAYATIVVKKMFE